MKNNPDILIVREATKKGFIEVLPEQCFDATFPNSKTRRGRLMLNKSNCLTATNYDFRVYLGDGVSRKFTPVEAERLQTVPDNYTNAAADAQRYKMLGNGWTIDIIKHIFNYMDQNKPLNVLSLFDGMSCGQLALQRAGIPVANYYASEIDKHAIKVTMANFPNTQQLGSVTEIKHIDWKETKIDLLIGGSPCQGFSFAGKQLNFDDPRSALFFEFVRLLEEIKAVNPDVKFLLENVKMKKEYQKVITDILGVEPIEINSALVSAQNRKRLYWTNINGGIIPQPEDKGILLKDILEFEVDEKWIHSQKPIDYIWRSVSDGRNHFDFKHHSDTDNEKASCVTANTHKGVPYNVLISDKAISRISRKNYSHPKIMPEKTGTLNSKNNSGQLSVDSGTTLIPQGKYLRRLMPLECERLQTVPDGYTGHVSDSQRYRMLGNGWTVDVISHIFSFMNCDTDTDTYIDTYIDTDHNVFNDDFNW